MHSWTTQMKSNPRQFCSYLLGILLLVLFCRLCSTGPINQNNADTSTPCLSSSQCQEDKPFVFTHYQNAEYCCQPGCAITVTVQGEGFEYTRTFYQGQTVEGWNDITNSTDVDDGGISKRSTDTDPSNKDDNSTSPVLFSTCVCRPVGEVSPFNLDFSDVSDFVDDALEEIEDALDALQSL